MSEATASTASPKTAIRIGDVHYDIDLSKIPYLSSLVNFEANAQPQSGEFVHDPIPLFDVALKGVESGYRHCFRSLPTDLSQYNTLCETYELLGVDILSGQCINDIFSILKSDKGDYKLRYKRYRDVKDNKSKARDTAFKLLHLILLGEFQDEIKDNAEIFKAVLFVVSHPRTFKRKTRTVVRAAYEDRFAISTKQRARLDRCEKTDAAKLSAEEDGDVTMEEEAGEEEREEGEEGEEGDKEEVEVEVEVEVSKDDDNFDHEKASPFAHVTRHRHLKEDVNSLRLRAPYLRAQPSTESAAKAEEKSIKHQSSLVRHADGFSVSRQNGSLLQVVYSDLCKIPGGLSFLLRHSYSFLKWPFLVYILWIIASHAYVACMNHFSQSVQPCCGKPIIGNMIPFCPGPGGTRTSKAADLVKGTTSQQELGSVMASVGQHHELTRAMVKHEWALSDLKILVSASKLRRKTDLEDQLKLLIKFTEDTAWAASDFIAKVIRLTDVVIAVDQDTVRQLEAIEDPQTRLPSLKQTALSMLKPFSAFRATGNALTEAELKEVFLRATSRIANRLPSRIQDAWELHLHFKNIQSTLIRIEQLAVEEIGDHPEMAILASLWNQLARADEYAEDRSHKKILEDLTGFYKNLGEMIVETIFGLVRMKSELKEFRDEFAATKLIPGDFSLNIIMSMMWKSAQRLQREKRELQRIYVRELKRPDATSTITSTVYPNRRTRGAA